MNKIQASEVRVGDVLDWSGGEYEVIKVEVGTVKAFRESFNSVFITYKDVNGNQPYSYPLDEEVLLVSRALVVPESVTAHAVYMAALEVSGRAVEHERALRAYGQGDVVWDGVHQAAVNLRDAQDKVRVLAEALERSNR